MPWLVHHSIRGPKLPHCAAGLLGFPSKDLQYRFLCTFKPVFYIRQRDYSKVSRHCSRLSCLIGVYVANGSTATAHEPCSSRGLQSGQHIVCWSGQS